MPCNRPKPLASAKRSGVRNRSPVSWVLPGDACYAGLLGRTGQQYPIAADIERCLLDLLSHSTQAAEAWRQQLVRGKSPSQITNKDRLNASPADTQTGRLICLNLAELRQPAGIKAPSKRFANGKTHGQITRKCASSNSLIKLGFHQEVCAGRQGD